MTQVRKLTKVPGVDFPAITPEPPYQMMNAIPNPPKNSMTGDESPRTTTALISRR